MTGEVPVCPECDSTRVHRTNGRGFTGEGRDHYCKGCNTVFDDPDRRELKQASPKRTCSALANALIDAAPDEVGR